jgi:hypothetical protein
MKPNSLVFCILILILLSSCKMEDPVRFTLYLDFIVYSESGAYPDTCLTFKVTIDGKKEFSDNLCNVGAEPCALIYSFPIEPGSHKIQAQAAGISGQLDTVVYIARSKKFGYLNYHSDIDSFDFYLSTVGGIDK